MEIFLILKVLNVFLLQNFFKKCPNDMLKADQVPVHLSSGDGSATHLRSLAIKQMRLESISQVSKGSSDRYTANLIIDVESKSNKYPIKNIMLPINFDASYAAGKKSGTKYISSCVSTSGGGEEGQYPGSGVIVYPSINAGRVDPYSAKGFDAPLSGFNEKNAVFIVPNGVRTLAMELIGGAKSDGAKGSPNPGDKCYGVCKVSSGEKCQIVITEGTTIKNKNYVAPPEGAKYVNFQDGTTDAKIGTFKDEYIPGSTSISCDSGCSASVGTTATSSNIDAFSCVAGGAGASPGHLIMRW